MEGDFSVYINEYKDKLTISMEGEGVSSSTEG